MEDYTILSSLFDSDIFDYINIGSVPIAGSECTHMCIAIVHVISSSIASDGFNQMRVP